MDTNRLRSVVRCGVWVLMVLAVAGCRRTTGGESADALMSEQNWPVMGSYASVQIRGGNRDLALKTARCAVDEVNAGLSVFSSTSDIAQVNTAAGTDAFLPLGEHARRVLTAAVRINEESGGAFNPMVGPLMEAWGFFRGGEHHAFPPSEKQLTKAQMLSDFAGLSFDAEAGMARLQDVGMRLDFGAIAKGYAVDVAFDQLRAVGLTNFLMNIGGNMRISGQPEADRAAWFIAVRDPRRTIDTEPLGVLALTDGMAVSTSGNYEQFFEKDGHRYTHILDPRTGLPVEGMAQVTVIAASAMEADALSTACFVLGTEAGTALLERHYPDSGAMFIATDARGELVVVFAGVFERLFTQGKAATHEQ